MLKTEKICEKDGREIFLYTLDNQNGMRMRATNYGGIILSLTLPNKDGGSADVVLGFDTVEEYFGDHPFFGATIGRCANRIAGGCFELGGEKYCAPCNENGVNLLHGGGAGFHRAIWGGKTEGDALLLTYCSPEGEGGFPGTVTVSVMMELTGGNALRITYDAHTDADTIVNLTNHSYFNLRGCGEICDHILWLDADEFTPVDGNLIPTGRIATVENTPFDFTGGHAIGRDIGKDNSQLKLCGGYDHNFVLRGKGFRRAARVEDRKSGRGMEVYTDQPGVQFYTANALQGAGGYGAHTAYCFETQGFPDSVHHDKFPSCILKKGEAYHTVTEYRFFDL